MSQAPQRILFINFNLIPHYLEDHNYKEVGISPERIAHNAETLRFHTPGASVKDLWVTNSQLAANIKGRKDFWPIVNTMPLGGKSQVVFTDQHNLMDDRQWRNSIAEFQPDDTAISGFFLGGAVQQTAFGLANAGYKVSVLSDMTASQERGVKHNWAQVAYNFFHRNIRFVKATDFMHEKTRPNRPAYCQLLQYEREVAGRQYAPGAGH